MTQSFPRRLLSSLIIAATLVPVPAALSQEQGVPSVLSAKNDQGTVNAAALAEIDRALAEALQASDEAGRKRALQRAQQALDRLPKPGPATESGDGRWAVPANRRTRTSRPIPAGSCARR